MAHATREELEDLDSLLAQIRAIEAIKEKSFGCFYRKGKGVLHVHVQKERRFAHVSDGKIWHEVDLPVGANQRKALARIREVLLP